MINDVRRLIGSSDYYELKVPYAIFPKSEYLKFETRIIKGDNTHPFSYVKINETKDHLQAGIMVGEEAVLPSFLTKQFTAFKDMGQKEQMAIIYHELLHLLISYHILMLPELERLEKNKLVEHIFPNGFSNLVHDFMIDTVGNELYRQQALLRFIFDKFNIPEWHYYNYLKNPEAKETTLEDFLYGNYLEGHKYSVPKMFEIPDELREEWDPIVVQSYEKLDDMIAQAMEKFLTGIAKVAEHVRNRDEGYTGFFSDEYLLSEITEQRTIHDLVAIMKQLNDDLDMVIETAQNLIPDLGDLLDIAEQQNIVANTGIKLPGMQPNMVDEVTAVNDNNSPVSLDELENILKKISDQLKEAKRELEQTLARDTATGKAQVAKLEYQYYTKEVEDKVLDALHNINTSTRLRNISSLLTAYNGYIAKVDHHSNRGKLNVRDVVRQFPDIVSQKDQRPEVYQQTQVHYLPKLKILTIFDLSGSMETVNMVLKPFFSKFYQEGLSALFDIKMADFSVSVVLENWDYLPQGAYYAHIQGEGGTDPMSAINLDNWRNIVEDLKPDAICFYTDGEYYTPGDDRSDSTNSIKAFEDYFKTLGVDMVKGFKTDEHVRSIDELDPLIEGTLGFLEEVVEKKYKQYSAGREMEL